MRCVKLTALVALFAGLLPAVPDLCAQNAASAQYVAMGSSIASGPGLGTRDPGSPPLCMRSSINYAHLFAAKRGLTLRDVTCSGATTAGILTGQRMLPPQIDAVGPETELVTISIGGNDVHLAENLFAWSCANAPKKIPDAWRPWICREAPQAQVDDAFGGLEAHLRAIVDGIHQRAPHARIVFVDYVQLVPPSGTCPHRLPLTKAQLAQARADEDRLAAMTAKVARETGSGLLQASVLSRGHDVCAADSWIFPLEFPPHLMDFAPLAYHPKAEAMAAIAEALDKMIPAH
ncbi:MAG TPA: SGNH/GDSL hydrolase family protein [Acidobacteriaceae bacterium]|nr:SGNH/GDSL hydrolase family protein [Acidobacteriaceae bacterium]